MPDIDLSFSSLQNFKNCHRKHKIENVEGWQRRGKAIPLIAGSAFHAFVGAHQQGVKPKQCAKLLDQVFKNVDIALYDPEATAKFHVEWARMMGMATAYVRHYKEDADKYTRCLVEEHQRIRLLKPKGNGVTYHGYIDCLMQDAAGDWWIKETKTAAKGTVTADYLSRIRIDSQTRGYFFLAKKLLGEFPRGVVYDIAMKTQHSKKAGETISQFADRMRNLYSTRGEGEKLFHREPVIMDRGALRDWWDEHKQWAYMVKRAYDDPKYSWLKNDGHCMGRYGACRNLPICTSGRVDAVLYEKRERYGKSESKEGTVRSAKSNSQAKKRS